MDPYLEHPALWPDFHDSLIAAVRDAMSPVVAPRYFIGLERRAYRLKPDDIVFIGRPDIAVLTRSPERDSGTRPEPGTAVLEVDVPLSDEVDETFLEVHEVLTGKIVTVLEILSPANKLHAEGRKGYEEKRDRVLATRTNLVEVDLLRAGEPMPVIGAPIESDYRILVSRGDRRPRSRLYAFGLRQPIPRFPLPLLPGDSDPTVDLNSILHGLYDRARFDLRLDYARPAVPPLAEKDGAWARELIGKLEAGASGGSSG
jgi:hypothetical protein